MIESITSIGIFIDGGYFTKINQALEEKLSLNIDITFFFKFIKEKIAYEYNLNTEFCQITESHYYRRRYSVNDANNKHLLFSERKFEDSLIENDVIFHYKHLREIQKEGEINVIEKGIDVWFALEAYELSLFRKFDFVILITGDADECSRREIPLTDKSFQPSVKTSGMGFISRICNCTAVAGRSM